MAKQVRDEVALGVAEMREKHGVTPGLAAVLVGEDPASAIYVRNKGRACEEVGMFSETFLLPGDATQSQVSSLVDQLNQDQRFHGILVQLPLPAQMDEAAAIQELEPLKDVDGIHPYNLGKLLQGTPIFVPGTPAGIQQLLIRNKGRACEEVVMFSETFLLPGDATQPQVSSLIDQLNQDHRFHGILVQLPLPAQLDEAAAIQELEPLKDVDGIHPYNLGKLLQGAPIYVPGTPAGIQQLLIRNGYDPAGKHTVICGRSNIVGKPLAALLMQRQEGANATVTVCHTRTKNLAELTRQADILVAAMGQPGAITADMVRDGVVVIDVGINRVDDPSRRRGYRLEGDVDFAAVSQKAEAITPVPGGVGPMTIAMLLVNTLKAARLSIHGE